MNSRPFRNPRQQAQHDMKGGLHALMLSVQVLPILHDADEIIQTLDGIDESAARVLDAIERLDKLEPEPDR